MGGLATSTNKHQKMARRYFLRSTEGAVRADLRWQRSQHRDHTKGQPRFKTIPSRHHNRDRAHHSQTPSDTSGLQQVVVTCAEKQLAIIAGAPVKARRLLRPLPPMHVPLLLHTPVTGAPRFAGTSRCRCAYRWYFGAEKRHIFIILALFGSPSNIRGRVTEARE